MNALHGLSGGGIAELSGGRRHQASLAKWLKGVVPQGRQSSRPSPPNPQKIVPIVE